MEDEQEKGNDQNVGNYFEHLSFDSTSDEFNITEDEIEQVEKEAIFVAAISQDISSIKMGDWILAKFCPRKVNKFYVGQITEPKQNLALRRSLREECVPQIIFIGPMSKITL